MTSDKSVLVLGGVGGIGEALARRLVAQGTRVVLTSRSTDRATQLAREIGAEAARVDVGDEVSIVTAVNQSAGSGGLDGLAYCIGSLDLKPIERTTADDMMTAYRLNVIGAFLAIRAATAPLRQAGGSVVLFSSVVARQGFPNHAALGAAKAGVEGLMLALAADLAPKVRVNAIAPSLTDTPLARGFTQNPKMAEAIAGLHPLSRLGTANDMSALAAFLLSPDAGWITGQVLAVDGGRSSLRVGRS